MHSNEMEDIESASGGDVVAVFGVECASMDTFTDGSCRLAMASMFVPKPGDAVFVCIRHLSRFILLSLPT